MLPENKEFLYNKDGKKIGVFIELETYKEIEEKIRYFEEVEGFLEDLEDYYFGNIALQRLKEYESGDLETISHEELKRKLGLTDEKVCG